MIQSFNLSQILDALYRRKDLIVAISLVIATLTTYLAFHLPDVFRSSTLILVTPQSLPANYVASTVTSTIAQRMRGIAQQVLGRTILEKVVQEFDLFHPSGSEVSLERRVLMLRQRITLSINQTDTFSLSFDAETPETAQRVTARLAERFIEENLNVREQQAAGTTSFISAESERLRRELEEQEARVNRFQAQHWNELPSNRDANAHAMDQLRRELENGIIRIETLKDRKVSLENQIAEAETLEREFAKVRTLGIPASGTTQTVDPKIQLDNLLSKYSERHPDVIRLKREIESSRIEMPAKESTKTVSNQSVTLSPPLRTALQVQLTDINRELASLQARIDNVRTEIKLFQSRLDNVALRAMEYSKITRNYDITLKKYQDLLAKSLESELSENMEKKQKGEQFRIVDPASFPQNPASPNRPRMIIVGILLGIGAGISTSFLLERFNTSFKRTDDLEGFTNIPLLATLPTITTRGQVIAQWHERSILILASGATLAVGLFLIPLVVRTLLFF